MLHGAEKGGRLFVPPLTSLVSYTPGDVLSLATFTRASTANYLDATGLLQTAGSDVPRDGHYIGATRTYLSEPAATNTLRYGSDFGQLSVWTRIGGSNSFLRSDVPDLRGTLTGASQLTINAVSGSTYSDVSQTPSGQPASPQTFSVWLKGYYGGEIVWIYSTADNITYQRTLCTLTLAWKRFSVTTLSAGGYRFAIGRDLRDASQTAQASSAYLYAQGAQVELGSIASSTIEPTTSSSVTRAADALTIPWSATPVAMTVYAKTIDQGISAQADATGKVIASVGNANNRFTICQTSTPDISLNYRVASTDHVASDTASTPAFGDTVEYRATLSAIGAIGMSHSTNAGTESTPVTLTGATTRGADDFTRANSTSTLGTALTGGAWSALTTAGITGNKGYWPSDRSGGNLAWLAMAALSDTQTITLASNSLHYYGPGILIRYTDVSNFLRLTFLTGVGLLESRVAGVTTTRGTYTTTLPGTGPTTFTVGVTILSNVVSSFVNGVQIGTSYTLSGTEITAYGSSLNAGAAGCNSGTVGTSATFRAYSATSGTSTVALPGAWDSANIEIASLAGAQQGGLALVGLSVVPGVILLAQARTSRHKAINGGPDVTPASIVLNPTAVTMQTGGSDVNFVATVRNVAGSVLSNAVVFTTDNTNVCTINSSTGVCHAANTGSAIITATTTNSLVDTTTVTVTADTVPYAATISPTSLTMVVGASDQTFTGYATNQAGAALPGTVFTYTSSTPAVATIAMSTGVAHAVAAGSTTITATTSNGKTATAALTVSANITPAAISVSPTAMALPVGGTDGQITAIVTNSSGGVISGATVTYVSSAPSVATVTSGGLVHAVANGSTTVTATDSASHTATCAVTVTSPTTPTGITVAPSTLALSLGASDFQMTATVTGTGGTIPGSPVTWTSSNPAIATVGFTTGLVHPLAAGTTTITGTTSNGLTATSACTCSSSGARVSLFPHARFRIIQRWTGTTDDAFANAHFSDIDGGTLATHPNAINVMLYTTLGYMEIDSGSSWNGNAWTTPHDNPYSTVTAIEYAQAYATAHGDNVENYWLHAASGQPNFVMNIFSISSLGVVRLKDQTHGGNLSYPYQVGWEVTIAGTAMGAGVYTIANIQQNGFTVTDWLNGALGTGGTVSTISGGTNTAADRLTFFDWSEWWNTPNLRNANCRAMHVQRYVDIMAHSGTPLYNGSLIDNMDSASLARARAASSNEYPTNGFNLWNADLATTLAAILAASGGPTYLRINTSGYVTATDIANSRAAKGVHGETMLTLLSVYDHNFAISYVNARVGEGIDYEFSSGDTWTIAGGVGTDNSSSALLVPGSYTTKTQRMQMAMYCMYLMVVDPSYVALDGRTLKHAIMDITNGYGVNQGPLSAMWQPAFEYNIGQPAGGYTKSGVLIDPSGHQIRTFQRVFSLDGGATLSAVAVFVGNVNTTSGNGDNYGDNSLMSVAIPTAPAGKVWLLLNADGSLGTTTFSSTVPVRRAEGVVLIASSNPVLALATDTSPLVWSDLSNVAFYS